LKGFNDEATRENIKAFFDEFAKVKYVDFSKGQLEGYVRFAEKDQAKVAFEKTLEKLNGELTFKNAKLEGRVLEGDEELQYWKDLIKNLSERRQNKKNNNKRRGGNRRGNNNYRNNGKKRSLDEEGEEEEDGDGGEENENGQESSAKKIKA
jgi:hypothetical protein